MGLAAREKAFDTLQKRFISLGFAIAFATVGFAAFVMPGVYPDPSHITLWLGATGWLLLVYLGINAIVHTVLIGRAAGIGWAIVNVSYAPVLGLMQVLAASTVLLIAGLTLGQLAAIGANLLAAALALVYYRRCFLRSRAVVAKPTVVDLAAIDPAFDRELADPEAELRERFAKLEKSQN